MFMFVWFVIGLILLMIHFSCFVFVFGVWIVCTLVGGFVGFVLLCFIVCYV